jgi:Cysteine-rich secretory protein family
MLDALNADRAAAGLVAVRADSRLMDIARARSVDMATKHYFSHTQPDGRNVFDIMKAAKITYFNAGEIIAWNNYPTLELSAANANSQWMNSPGHRAIVLSADLNYIGVGLAIDASTGKKIWTAVYIKGPDRTGAKSTTNTPSVSAGATPATKRVRVTWTGADVRLQVLTSGFYGWQVQRRTDGGAWTTVWVTTTIASMTLDLPAGHTYEFRTAARDKAGNWGSWSTVTTTLALPIGVIGTGR